MEREFNMIEEPKEVYKMNEPVSEKDLLLMMLNEMNEQLEELDSIIETSFSELRSHWFREEVKKLSVCSKRVSLIESKKINSHYRGEFASSSDKKQTSSLKLELGLH